MFVVELLCNSKREHNHKRDLSGAKNRPTPTSKKVKTQANDNDSPTHTHKKKEYQEKYIRE